MPLLQYAKFVKPSFEEFILPSMKHADVIIPRGADNEVAVDLIVQHIRTKLGQHDLCKIYSNVFVIYSTFQVLLFSRLCGIVLQTEEHNISFCCVDTRDAHARKRCKNYQA